MSATDITTDEILLQQSDETLAEWWCLFNKFDWPEGLPKTESENELVAEMADNARARWYMDWIIGQVGMKACLRAWNKENLPGEQFDLWWKEKFGDKEF